MPEVINHELQNDADKVFSFLDNSTLTSLQVDLGDLPETYDSYTYVSPQPHNTAILASCDFEIDMLDQERKCRTRKLFWRESPAQAFSQNPATNVIVLEGSENQLVFIAGENVASTELWSITWEQAEVQEAFWRGVYSPSYKRKILFSKTLTFKTSELPRWKPMAIIGRRNFEDDDA
jgi:hypothetical protein